MLTYAERKALFLRKTDHQIAQATIGERIRKMLRESDGFTVSLKTTLGDHYRRLLVVGSEARFIAFDFEGNELLVNVDHIVELLIEQD